MKLSISTTDPKKFYMTRKSPHHILKGWQKQRQYVLDALQTKKIENDVTLITRGTCPIFFDDVSPDYSVWDVLDGNPKQFDGKSSSSVTALNPSD